MLDEFTSSHEQFMHSHYNMVSACWPNAQVNTSIMIAWLGVFISGISIRARSHYCPPHKWDHEPSTAIYLLGQYAFQLSWPRSAWRKVTRTDVMCVRVPVGVGVLCASFAKLCKTSTRNGPLDTNALACVHVAHKQRAHTHTRLGGFVMKTCSQFVSGKVPNRKGAGTTRSGMIGSWIQYII